MKTFKTEDMHCNNCVKRINEALDKESIKHETNLDNKTVAIEDDSLAPKAVEILDDLGFEAVEV